MKGRAPPRCHDERRGTSGLGAAREGSEVARIGHPGDAEHQPVALKGPLEVDLIELRRPWEHAQDPGRRGERAEALEQRGGNGPRTGTLEPLHQLQAIVPHQEQLRLQPGT